MSNEIRECMLFYLCVFVSHTLGASPTLLNLILIYNWLIGKTISMPIYLDVEKVGDIAKAFPSIWK